MDAGLVSVVIPAYGQARFLGEAIRSVLEQTHRSVEAIVVDDASPDETPEVVRQFADPRVRCVVHERNLGLPEARNSGIRAARGSLVAFLDADDVLHPEKVRHHAALFDRDPGVGAAYNGRFELNHSAATIREIWRAPEAVGLADLVRGFPFAPSDMVVRREWLVRVGPFDPAMGSAEDTDLPCRLALAGCRFARVDRALNYRRYHSGRGRRNLPGRLADVTRALEAVFADPRCPADVLAIRHEALSHHLMVLVSLALLQEETKQAHEFLDQLAGTDPRVVEGHPAELVAFLMMESVADESADHERALQRMFAQLPSSLSRLGGQRDWAVARGYLWKGLRAALWERDEAARAWAERAVERRAALDEEFVRFLTSHLLNHRHELGPHAALAALARVCTCVERVAGRRAAGRLRGSYFVNRAFDDYRAGRLGEVPGLVLRAVGSDPSHLANRGVMAMLLRSVAQKAGRSGKAPE